MTFNDLWLGDSRELCAAIPHDSVNCVMTDPPWGVDALSNMPNTEHGKRYARKIEGDISPEVAIKIFGDVMDVLLPRTVQHCDMYIFTSWTVLQQWLVVAEELERHGFIYKNLLVWEKDGHSMGDLEAWGTSYEFIIFLKKGRRERTDTRRPSVIHSPVVRPNKLIHPHEKPIGLLEKLIKHSTSKGDLIVDPFAGSASTLRAARNLERNCIGIESDQENYNKALASLNVTSLL